MDFIDGREYAYILRTQFLPLILITANIAWEEGIKAFVREATETVFIDTAMSAVSLIAPADVINSDFAEGVLNKVLSKRKRIKAKPLHTIDGDVIRGAYRNALSAYSLAKKNTKVLELSLKNSILTFDYTVSAWQISQNFATRRSMNDRPIILGFEAFEKTVVKEFDKMEKKIQLSKFLDPFSNKGVKFTSKVTG